MYDIITIGSVTRDAFLKSDDFKIVNDNKFRTGRGGCFVLGAKMEVPNIFFTTGGGSTNSAVGLARMGLKTACVGAIGDDISGKEIKKELKKEKVADLLQTNKNLNTAYSIILVAPDGERTILEYRGANDYLSEKKINWKKLKSKWLYLDSLAGNENILKESLNWAKKNKIKIAFNPDKRMINAGEKIWPYLKNIDIFMLNEDEAGIFTKIPYSELAEKQIFRKLNEITAGIIIMTKGPKGAVVSDKKNVYTANTPFSPVVDRTGAGDSFGAGFVSGYIQSKEDIKYAIQIGTANATSVVQYFGAKKGLLKNNELDKFWKKFPKAEISTEKI